MKGSGSRGWLVTRFLVSKESPRVRWHEGIFFFVSFDALRSSSCLPNEGQWFTWLASLSFF